MTFTKTRMHTSKHCYILHSHNVKSTCPKVPFATPFLHILKFFGHRSHVHRHVGPWSLSHVCRDQKEERTLQHNSCGIPDNDGMVHGTSSHGHTMMASSSTSVGLYSETTLVSEAEAERPGTVLPVPVPEPPGKRDGCNRRSGVETRVLGWCR